MSSKSPVFPLPQPQHFSDYGFDPQIDYFQVLEEARKHKRESRSLDSLHFKLQKPISKEDSKKTKKKKKWWRNALLFWKWKWSEENEGHKPHHYQFGPSQTSESCYRAVSGPVYVVGESGSGTPSRSRPTSGPLAGTMTPSRKGDLEIPYLCLREMTVEEQQQRISTSSMPIYLVT